MKILTRGPVPFLIIALLGLIVYANSLVNEFVYDDEILIIANPFVKNWKYLGEIFSTTLFSGGDLFTQYYRPLQAVTFLFDYSLWKLNPAGYHLTNLTLHVLCSCLLFLLIRLLLRNSRVALAAAVLFAIHPIHTQAVTYVSGRADPLATLFMLLSLLLFLKTTRRAGGENFWSYAGSLVSFALALASKEIALILPLTLIFTDFCFPPAGRKEKMLSRALRLYPAYFIIAAAYLLIRARVMPAAVSGVAGVPGPGIRLLTTAKVIFLYLGLLCLPLKLHMERQVTLLHSLFEPAALVSIPGLIIITVLLVRSFRRSRTAFFAGAWFFLHLLPVANIVPLVAPMAEHWLYVPSMGFFLLLALAGENLSRSRPAYWKSLGSIALIFFLGFYSFLTIRRNRDWKDNLTFYRHTLQYSPGSARMHNGLGVTYQDKGKLEEAIAEYRTAIRLDPNYAEAHNNLGLAYRIKGLLTEAAAEYEIALKLNPDSAKLHFNIGSLLAARGQREEAIAHYQTSIKLNPYYPETHLALGTAYLENGLPDKAMDEYRQTLSLRPDNPMALNNLGYLYVEHGGDPKKGIELIERALASDPDNPSFLDSLGWAYYRLGDREMAYPYLKRALSLAPGNPDIQEHLRQVEEEE